MRDLSPGAGADELLATTTSSRERSLVPMVYKGQSPSSSAPTAMAPRRSTPQAQQEKKEFLRTMRVAGFDDDAGDQLAQNYQYTWSNDNYSETKRNIDTWSFVLSLRAKLWLLEQPWSYGPGGMTDEKKSARARWVL